MAFNSSSNNAFHINSLTIHFIIVYLISCTSQRAKLKERKSARLRSYSGATSDIIYFILSSSSIIIFFRYISIFVYLFLTIALKISNKKHGFVEIQQSIQKKLQRQAECLIHLFWLHVLYLLVWTSESTGSMESSFDTRSIERHVKQQ